MIFADIPPHTRVFIDANTFIYHFAPHPLLQAPCQQFLERVCQNDVSGFTSTHVLSNVAHRLMTLEAMAAFGWPAAGIVYRLQRQSAQIWRLTAFRQSIEEVPALGIQVLPVAGDHVLAAVEISQRNGLLCGDALVVAMMRAHGLTHLASHDADFDCEAGLTRYAPAWLGITYEGPGPACGATAWRNGGRSSIVALAGWRIVAHFTACQKRFQTPWNGSV